MISKTQKAKVFCFSNHKGGVGKTCSACNIGAGLARKGKKVLLIDLDPQANLSTSLGVKGTDKNVYQVFTNQIKLNQAIYSITENLDLVPGSLDLAGVEVELISEPGRELVLKNSVALIQDQYDYILIDCPPSLGILTSNALTVSDRVIIPLEAHYLAVQGVEKLKNIIEKVKCRLNSDLDIGGVLITKYDSRTTLNRDIAEQIEIYFPSKVFKTKIRTNIVIAEAPSFGKDVFRYSPKSNGAEDYSSICDEILEQYSFN